MKESADEPNQLPGERSSFLSPDRIGHACARGLGIDVNARRHLEPKNLEARATEAISPYRPYSEDEPTATQWLADHRPTVPATFRYVKSLFPFTRWIFRYNLQWLLGDAIGGMLCLRCCQ